ncbi:MAG: carbon-nitrogen hydrolase family protein, partial [Krumholzibacteria bacterium]|nr:carbon-nitrogen hydrolase family protein [Candidatus Krumholzibacteria bacterium]
VLARAGGGRDEILLCDVDLAEADRSPARQLFLRDRRPELYPRWLGPS